jgi:hypothetical protein
MNKYVKKHRLVSQAGAFLAQGGKQLPLRPLSKHGGKAGFKSKYVFGERQNNRLPFPEKKSNMKFSIGQVIFLHVLYEGTS